MPKSKPPRKKKAVNPEVHKNREKVAHLRTNITRVLREVESGSVSIEDLAKLRNFCQISMYIIRNSQPGAYDRAMKDAELAGLLTDQAEDIGDYGVVVSYPETTFDLPKCDLDKSS